MVKRLLWLVFIGVIVAAHTGREIFHAQSQVAALYALSEGTGTTTADASGNSNTMTLGGSASWITTGRFGAGWQFLGGSSGAEIPSSVTTTFTSSLTFSAWVYPTADGPHTVFSKGTGNTYFLRILSNRVPQFDAYLSNGYRAVYSPQPLPLNAWSHVAVTYDGATLRLYVNGIEMARTVATGTLPTSTDSIWLGSRGGSEQLVGKIDEVRFYSQALSAGDIALTLASPIDTATPFQVSVTTPSAGATGILTTPISATFSRAADPTTVNTNTLELRDEANALVTSSVTYDVASQRATLTPSSALPASATYSVRIVSGASGVRDLQANPLASDVTWSFRTATTSQTPVAEFAFSENIGATSEDTSGNGNTASLYNGTAWTSGKYSTGLSFDGVNDTAHVYASDTMALTGSFTYEAWIRATDAASRRVFVRSQPDWQQTLNLSVISGGYLKFELWLSDGYRSVTSSIPVALDTWAYVAATYDGTMVRLYLDGTEVAATAATGVLAATSHPLLIGDLFAGSIDEVRLYRRALTAAEINTDMTSPVDDAPPVVTAVTPAAGAIGVEVTTAVTATFNEPLLASTVTTDAFELRDSAGVLQPSVVTYSAATKTATLVPLSALDDGVTYTATLKGGASGPRVTDPLGNALSANDTWSFTTFNDGVLMAPIVTPGAATFISSVTVSMSAQVSTSIRYTLNGGDPTATSPLYTAPFTLTTPTVVKAKAFRTNFSPSATREVSYGIRAAAPVINPADGTWPGGTVVTFSSPTPGTQVYCTINGREPTTADSVLQVSSPLYVGNFTLKARAFAGTLEASDVVVRTYTLSAPLSLGTIGGGTSHSVALRPDGSVTAWGYNGTGRQLGVVYCSSKGVLSTDTPVASEATGIKALDTTNTATAAVRMDGTVVSWGTNDNQQLGHSLPSATCTSLETADRPTVREISGLTGVSTLDGGMFHFLALKTDQTVWSWGRNVEGQLGNNSTTDSSVPVQASGLTGVVAISAGSNHSLALKSDGTLWSWGSNQFGQLGVTGGMRKTPVQVTTVTNAVAITAGWSASFAVLADGTAWIWGSIPTGLVPGAPSWTSTPRQIPGLSGIKSIASGQTATYALGQDGRIWAWGTNTYGQLADNTTTTRNTPALIQGLPAIRAVAAGNHHALAVALDGSLWAWGRNHQGQVGDLGTGTDRLNATLVQHHDTLAPVTMSTPGTYDPALDVVRYYHTDAIGSVRMMTDAAGQVLQRFDYKPFGQEWTIVTLDDKRRFTAHERDSETGFDYFGARSYANTMARFTTIDPVVGADAALTNPQNWNRYAYVQNNPLRLVDPDGKQGVEINFERDVKALLSGQISAEEFQARNGARGAGAALGALIVAGPTVWRAAVSCLLSPSCQSSAIEILEGSAGAPPRLSPTRDIDPAAVNMARKYGGQPNVRIEGFGDRAFDMVSPGAIGQTTRAASALLKPDNYLNPKRREQIRATLEAAKATGRIAIFEFERGAHTEVLDFIRRNAERIGVHYEIQVF